MEFSYQGLGGKLQSNQRWLGGTVRRAYQQGLVSTLGIMRTASWHGRWSRRRAPLPRARSQARNGGVTAGAAVDLDAGANVPVEGMQHSIALPPVSVEVRRSQPPAQSTRAVQHGKKKRARIKPSFDDSWAHPRSRQRETLCVFATSRLLQSASLRAYTIGKMTGQADHLDDVGNSIRCASGSPALAKSVWIAVTEFMAAQGCIGAPTTAEHPTLWRSGRQECEDYC